MDGILPALLAAGSVSAERWIATARRPRARRVTIGVLTMAGTAVIVPSTLPVLPVADLSKVRRTLWPHLKHDD